MMAVVVAEDTLAAAAAGDLTHPLAAVAAARRSRVTLGFLTLERRPPLASSALAAAPAAPARSRPRVVPRRRAALAALIAALVVAHLVAAVAASSVIIFLVVALAEVLGTTAPRRRMALPADWAALTGRRPPLCRRLRARVAWRVALRARVAWRADRPVAATRAWSSSPTPRLRACSDDRGCRATHKYALPG